MPVGLGSQNTPQLPGHGTIQDRAWLQFIVDTCPRSQILYFSIPIHF